MGALKSIYNIMLALPEILKVVGSIIQYYKMKDKEAKLKKAIEEDEKNKVTSNIERIINK